MTEDLTPAELRAITGKVRASAQAAALARKGIGCARCDENRFRKDHRH